MIIDRDYLNRDEIVHTCYVRDPHFEENCVVLFVY